MLRACAPELPTVDLVVPSYRCDAPTLARIQRAMRHDLGDRAEEDRDDPDMLAVERMRRPAAALGPNWLALMTGRAQEDGVAGW